MGSRFISRGRAVFRNNSKEMKCGLEIPGVCDCGSQGVCWSWTAQNAPSGHTCQLWPHEFTHHECSQSSLREVAVSFRIRLMCHRGCSHVVTLSQWSLRGARLDTHEAWDSWALPEPVLWSVLTQNQTLSFLPCGHRRPFLVQLS